MSTANWQNPVYSGLTLPIPDSGGVIEELQPVGKYNRNANGRMIIQRVADLWVVRMAFSGLDGIQVGSIMSHLEINRSGPLFFYSPKAQAFIIRQVYYGAGVSVPFLQYTDDGALQRYNTLNVNFIEV